MRQVSASGLTNSIVAGTSWRLREVDVVEDRALEALLGLAGERKDFERRGLFQSGAKKGSQSTLSPVGVRKQQVDGVVVAVQLSAPPSLRMPVPASSTSRLSSAKRTSTHECCRRNGLYPGPGPAWTAKHRISEPIIASPTVPARLPVGATRFRLAAQWLRTRFRQ